MNKTIFNTLLLSILSSLLHVICLDIPPPPIHDGVHSLMKKQYKSNIDERLLNYNPKLDKEYAWEMSGLFEGDIMFTNNSDGGDRNGILDSSRYWPQGVVPFFISDDFDSREQQAILGAMNEFHQRSCIRFRNYQNGDEALVYFTGSKPGCWSYVGRTAGGQVINLQNSGCMRHGTIVHEILHALGFHHQQSAADRDNYVTIMWNNIVPQAMNNFENYSPREVTDFMVGYDYDSVMHYEAFAFSKNGRRTIVPKQGNARLGQRRGMSPKDVQKLNIMYNCQGRGG